LSLEWEIKNGTDKTELTEKLETLLKKLDIYRLINDILDCTLFGFQPIEIIWGKVDNLILPIELKSKPPEWFCFDDENQLKFRTKEHYYGEELPPKKFLCPQSNPSYENPYGERTLSRVFWPATFKKGGMKFWVIFTEKYGIPHLVGKHPRGASKEETDNLADLLEDMVQDAVAVIPDDSSVEIQEANKSSSAEVFEKLIDKMNAEISKAILGQTLTTEIGANGSYAASNTHFAVRQDIIDSDKKLVEKTINQLIQWICDINFANQDVPVFEMYQEEDVDLTLAQRDKIISECGVKFTKEYFIKTFGYEDEDFEIIETPKPDSNFSQFKEEEKIEGQVQIDELFKFLSETELSVQAQKMLNPLISLLESCESFEEAKELLTDKIKNNAKIKKAHHVRYQTGRTRM
jgi:phage gp29-like protein